MSLAVFGTLPLCTYTHLFQISYYFAVILMSPFFTLAVPIRDVSCVVCATRD